MASPLMKRPTFDREAAIQEVIRGCELTAWLRSFLGVDPQRELVDGLMEEVSQSFTRALSLLKRTGGISESIQEPPASVEEGSASPRYHGSLEETGLPAKGAHNLRRGHLEKWTTITSNPHHDGYGWRKYGQKKIIRSEFPRNYYRCTHRDNQGCLAAKLVQQKNCNDPPMFVVTYIRQHTCKSSPISQLSMDCFPSEPCMLSFGSDCSGIKQGQSLHSSFNSTSEVHMGDHASPKFDTSPSSDCPVSPEPTRGVMLSGMRPSPISDGFDSHLLMDPWSTLDERFGFNDWEIF